MEGLGFYQNGNYYQEANISHWKKSGKVTLPNLNPEKHSSYITAFVVILNRDQLIKINPKTTGTLVHKKRSVIQLLHLVTALLQNYEVVITDSLMLHFF